MSRPVTIHSDGTGRGTVVLSEDGEKLGGVTDVSISIAANGIAEATIEIKHTSLNIKANVTEVLYTCPCCGSMMEHYCDSAMGGASTPNMCDSVLTDAPGAVARRYCIRGANHPDSHFDGTRAW